MTDLSRQASSFPPDSFADGCLPRAVHSSGTPLVATADATSQHTSLPCTNDETRGRHPAASLSHDVDAYLEAEREKHPEPTPTETCIWLHLSTHCIGRDSAASGADLAIKFGVSKRTVQDCVERLRKLRRRLIASSTEYNGGYFIPAIPEEARAYLGELRARAAVQHAGVTQQEAAFRASFGQLALFGQNAA